MVNRFEIKIEFSVYLLIDSLIVNSLMSSPPPNIADRLASERKLNPPAGSSLNDFDFYTQKIVRLEEDYADVCAELQKVRARLRKA